MGAVSATDNERIKSYAITAGNTDNAFVISWSGLLTTASNIDYETNYSLTVQVTDGAGNTASNIITVNVISIVPPATDTNAPIIFSQSFHVLENVPIGSFVGVVSATDNERIKSYAITSGNANNTFAISWSGLLTTTSNIDYETTNTYSLTVEVTDGAGNTDNNTITVNVINIALPP